MFYQGTKTAKAAAIGTIMPWSGSLGTIPKGWIPCDGQTEVASNYPLLVQAIADTYNAGTSNLGGSFPMYTGNIVLPNLNGKTLMDIEPSYFGTGSSSTGKLAEADSDAGPLISPFIGENQGIGIPTVFNDVYTDVIFTLNDREGYQGKITGNTMIPGDGFKTVYIAPRKLGRDHIRGHNHSGSYETIDRNNFAQPGIGVIPYADVNFIKTLIINDGGAPGSTYTSALDTVIPPGSTSGFGQGQLGRIVAGVSGEVPPVNLKPERVWRSPLGPRLNKPFLGPGGSSGSTVPYGFGGGNVTIPAFYRNFYPDSDPTTRSFGTLVSPPTQDFDKIPGVGDPTTILAHTHDEIEVLFDTNTLKPQSSITAQVNIPVNTVPVNTPNIGALQINFNTSQPSLTCLYIIRAY